jgi:acyl-CoA thioesterase FadM
MGLIHTPRTLVAIGKGLLKRGAPNASQVGFGETPHVYTGRAGLLDLDYLGHMNNAAYLTHAELSRWQMTAQNGMLQKGFRHNCYFIVTSNTIRYRKEIRFGRFTIETSFMGMDDRTLWGVHNFYVPETNTAKTIASGSKKRIRAQVLVKAAVLQGKTVMKPRDFLSNVLQMDQDLIDKQLAFYGDESFLEMVRNYDALEDSMRSAAAQTEEDLQ